MDGCYDQIRFVLEADVLKYVFEGVHAFLYVGETVEDVSFDGGLFASWAAVVSIDLGWFGAHEFLSLELFLHLVVFLDALDGVGSVFRTWGSALAFLGFKT